MKLLQNPIIRIPERCVVAVSGGSDSMILLKFAQQYAKELYVIHVHHGTGAFADASRRLVEDYCVKEGIQIGLSFLTPHFTPSTGKEAYWRGERQVAYAKAAKLFNAPVLTAHHLDDAVETWIFSCLRGHPSLMAHTTEWPTHLAYKPFLIYSKSELLEWAAQRNFSTWLDDPTNSQSEYTRNYIRNELMPHALRVNPGLRTTIRNMLRP